MKAFLFPGQGSQAKGMGGDLFDRFAALTQKADAILGYSIKTLCLENPGKKLNETQFTQPALYVVNAMSYYRKLENSGVRPDYVAGHSLGEYNALLAAECFDFETGLAIVKKRGELMAKAPEGRMAAIMNASRDQVETILRDNGLLNVDVANHNTPKQIVISGKADEVQRAQSLFQHGELMYYPLNTSGAFHSRLMRAASEEFRIFLNGFRFAAPTIPVIANTTARPYRQGDVAANLATQLAGSVQWSDSIQYLMGLGRTDDEMNFQEIGHGEVLTKMLRHIPKPSMPTVREDVQPTAMAAVVCEQPVVPQSTDDLVRAWNARYPVGTKVQCTQHDYGDLETRTEAVTLFGHRAAIYMRGYNGYFDLTEIVPLEN